MTLAPAGHFYQQKKFQFPIWAIVYLPKLLTATLLRRKKKVILIASISSFNKIIFHGVKF